MDNLSLLGKALAVIAYQAKADEWYDAAVTSKSNQPYYVRTYELYRDTAQIIQNQIPHYLVGTDAGISEILATYGMGTETQLAMDLTEYLFDTLRELDEDWASYTNRLFGDS